MKKYFLILNPGSKGGSGKKKIDEILNAFTAKKITFDYAITKDLKDAYSLSVSANKNNYDVIIAVGGDGTINRVLNGFFDENGRRISEAVMGLIYTGTSPDFCKTYNIPVNVNNAIDVIFQNKIRQVPVGKIILCKANNPGYINCAFNKVPATEKEVNYFACCVNIGLGAEVARRANSGIRKYIGDFAGTFVSMLIALMKYKPSDFSIIKDDQPGIIKGLYNLSVGLTKYIASGMQVDHDLKENGNQFYNLAIKQLTLFKTPAAISALYSGRKIKNSAIIDLSYSSALEVSGNINSCIEFDGDPYGFLPCNIELAKDKLEILYQLELLNSPTNKF